MDKPQGKLVASEEITEKFSYTSPTEDQKIAMEELRAAATTLALNIDDNVPDGRYKSLAMTKLEECIMFANKAITKDGK